MFDFSTISKGTAALEIIILMLVAAIIGFVIAWLYWRRKNIQLNTAFEDYRKGHSVTNDEHNRILGLLKDCQGSLESTQAELQAELQAKKALEMKIQGLEKTKSELNLQVINQTRSLRQAGDEIADLKAQLVLAHENNAKVTNELAELRGKYDELKSDAALLVKDRDEFKRKWESCKAKTNIEPPKVTSPDAPPKKGGKKDKTEVLADIAAKRDTINFGRIGTATAADKDDLKVIKGIGPFIEAKLNALGIFTFAQISRFNDEDVTNVTKAIQFFPGRIQRDDWPGQAGPLAAASAAE